jgi:hypothetical protein
MPRRTALASFPYKTPKCATKMIVWPSDRPLALAVQAYRTLPKFPAGLEFRIEKGSCEQG